MYNGDRARKDMLVKYGFRLPAARDNRPLTFPEFNDRISTRPSIFRPRRRNMSGIWRERPYL